MTSAIRRGFALILVFLVVISFTRAIAGTEQQLKMKPALLQLQQFSSDWTQLFSKDVWILTEKETEEIRARAQGTGGMNIFNYLQYYLMLTQQTVTKFVRGVFVTVYNVIAQVWNIIVFVFNIMFGMNLKQMEFYVPEANITPTSQVYKSASDWGKRFVQWFVKD